MKDAANSRLFNGVPNPLFVIAGDDKICAANHAAEEFFHVSVASLYKLQLTEIIPPSSPLTDLLTKVRGDQPVIHEYGVAIGTPSCGGERIVDVQLAEMVENQGEVMVVIHQHIMAHKLDRQLSHRGAARAVTGMAAMLAHEIKNPLSGIRGAAQLLEPGLNDDDAALARLICTESDRIRDLVDQMEVFTDQHLMEGQPVNIHSVLDQVAAIAASGFAREITLVKKYDPSLPEVKGNHDQLVQVFLNLAKNGAEAIMSAGRAKSGILTFATGFRTGMRLRDQRDNTTQSLPLEICISDNGPGIDDDMVDHLFDPFVTSKESGKGLGLALVAKIIDVHGGIVELQSQTDAGVSEATVFRVLLPIYHGDRGAA